MEDKIVLVRAIDQQGAVVGLALSVPRRKSLAVMEAPELVMAKRARACFRRRVAAPAARYPWQVLALDCGGRGFSVVPLWHETVARETLARLYQAIWANAEIYRKAFSVEEASALVGQLDSGLVLLDAAGTSCGLVGGFPVARSGDETLVRLVGAPATSTYLAEWGLIDSGPASPYRGLGLGSLLLTLYLSGLVAAGQTDVVLVTAEKGYGDAQRNPARPLYEAHGFGVCQDVSGEPIGRTVTQRRLDGQMGTHASLYYHATAAAIRAALTPGAGPIEGIRFEE
ncbi:MAG: hypothetical protein M5U01_30980 [Ardenticatenaceae bacterium]|nr:hypothetical protein [Ardenticatenaceae bacterium]